MEVGKNIDIKGSNLICQMEMFITRFFLLGFNIFIMEVEYHLVL